MRFDQVGPQIKTRLLNASPRGLFLAMKDPRPVGTQFVIRIQIAEGPKGQGAEEIVVSGVVVHVTPPQEGAGDRPTGCGIYLTDINPAWVALCQQLAALER